MPTTFIKGEAKHWEPGQSYSPTGEARFLGDATYTQTVDNATRTARVDWDRDMKYPAVERLKYSEITTPTFGVLIDDKGAQQPMSGIRLAAHLRERERASPRLWCGRWKTRRASRIAGSADRAAHIAGGLGSRAAKEHLIVLFDRRRTLPAESAPEMPITSTAISNYDMILSD
jgi:hypothetical protein